jgi:pimeloyl-ACP methyl ester carboxylesterase
MGRAVQPWQESEHIVNGARLHVYRRGQGPAIVLAHGAMENGRVWSRVADELDSEYEVVAYDARCHGRSESISYGDGDSGDDLSSLVELLGLDRPFAWGHSMGAMAAVHAVCRHPQRFRAAVVEDPGWGLRIPVKSDGSLDREGMSNAMIELGIAQSKRSLDDLTGALRGEAPWLRDDELIASAQAKQEFRPVGDWAGSGHERNPWKQTVQRLRCPILLICGDVSQGAIVPDEISSSARELSNHVEVARFATGHSIHAQAWADCVPVVRGFLRRQS